VPEKNYLAFLNLLGITRDPPTPARVYLTFVANPPMTPVVPKGSRAQTASSETESPIEFETDEDISVLPINFKKAVLIDAAGGHYSNASPQFTEPPASGKLLRVEKNTVTQLALGFDDASSKAVQIEIHEAEAEGGERQAGLVQPRFLRRIREMPCRIQGPEQRQAFPGKVAHQKRLAAGVVIVGRVDPHAGPLSPLRPVGDARLDPRFRERPVPVVPEEPVRLAVVGDGQIGPAVALHVPHDHSQRLAGGSSDARLRRHVGERPVPIITVQN